MPRATLTEHWHREHGARPGDPDRGCWYFGSAPATGTPDGRFDVAAPHGTCYLGETPGVGARERCGRFLAYGMPIPEEHYEGRVVSTVLVADAVGDAVIADLAHPDAAKHQVTGELAAGNDYDLSAQWARALLRDGFDGLRYPPRFTPGGEAAIALFSTPAGPQPHRGVVESVPLVEVLADLGYDIERSAPPSMAAAGVDDALEPEPDSD